MPSTLAQTATILAVGRQPSGKSRAFSALRPGGLRRDRFQSRWHWADATRLPSAAAEGRLDFSLFLIEAPMLSFKVVLSDSPPADRTFKGHVLASHLASSSVHSFAVRSNTTRPSSIWQSANG